MRYETLRTSAWEARAGDESCHMNERENIRRKVALLSFCPQFWQIECL